MTPHAAAWIRANVWPPIWLRNYQHIPGTLTDCACQKPPSVECQRDAHSACRHDGHLINETVIQTNTQRAATFREPYDHPSPVRSGPNVLAWVWPAVRQCRQICTCSCHSGHEPEQTEPIQLDLFGMVS
ncbi:hypothetical protein [Streptomyces sp. NPDC059883]|uniref:hypothetical protein n=1 Tax=unclassified Streptomyces TaxID=2593676 RepID=UPI00364E08BA